MPAPIPLHRYWNPGISDHFYTTNLSELGEGANGWQLERTACHVFANQESGTVPLHRYWNEESGDHFYTTDFSELGEGKGGYAYEGVQCFVYPNGESAHSAGKAFDPAPLYRYFHAESGDHFYAIENPETDAPQGYTPEGVQCYVLKASYD